MRMPTSEPPTSIDQKDIDRFSAIADDWWNPKGKFAPLHRINPVRLTFIRDRALAHFDRPGGPRRPLAGLTALDIGCGGGLLCEPMARLGCEVTGVDASERNIAIARDHARRGGLEIDYRVSTAEGLLAEGGPGYDLILNMEVVEHVADPGAFLSDCARLLSPRGMMIVATLNRTVKALALAKIAAEYVLGWVPRHTHDWRKFLRPREITTLLSAQDVRVEGPFGMAFEPVSGQWRQSDDISINYFMVVTRNDIAGHLVRPQSRPEVVLH
jgi:2-polyprenyl-6-hydroxyphenyl methylase/3-demethylubiquinone-9 3-methyltransferase